MNAQDKAESLRLIELIEPETCAMTDDGSGDFIFCIDALRNIIELQDGEDMAAWGAAQEREKWASCFNEARDAILHDRGPLDGAGMDSDKTNAVLGILDDAFQNLI